MGRLRRSRAHHARRDVHRASRTRVRTKDLDQIQLIDLDPKNRAKLEAQPLDFDIPGLAQHYCVECAKYYETDHALQSHWKSKEEKQKKCNAHLRMVISRGIDHCSLHIHRAQQSSQVSTWEGRVRSSFPRYHPTVAILARLATENKLAHRCRV
ncbi:hypothetical protein AB1N83_010968 [Pleurotus pulmonarius]